jgi:hypothetical protein
MWYYLLNNQQVGPIDDDAIKKLITEGKLVRGKMVWTAGMAAWLPIEQTTLSLMLGANSSSLVSPNISMSNSFSNVNMGRPVSKNKYNLVLLQAPANNYAFQPSLIKDKRYPVVISNVRAFKDGIQVNFNNDYLNRFISSLKDSNLFLDAGVNFIDFGDNKKQYHQLSINATESWELHQTQTIITCILIGIASAIFFPFLLLFLLIKINKEFTQEMTVDFISYDGTKLTFSAKTAGKVNFGLFSNAQAAADILGGSVSTSNINSIINQIISNREALSL